MGDQETGLPEFDRQFHEYIEEMRQFDPEFCDEDEIADFIKTVREMCVIIPVRNGNKFVGFFAISAKDCHPKCDWYIHHAFVEKQYRHKGLMTRTAFTWLTSAPGVYGYDVIRNSPGTNGNTYAEGFWKHIFEELVAGFMSASAVPLAPVRPAEMEAKLNTHAYKVALRNSAKVGG